MIGENWRDVAGYEGLYQVSDRGRVKNVKRDAILSPAKNNRGYFRVLLCKDGVKTNKFVHRLVALSFVPNPDNKPQVNHIDGCKENNGAINLEWVTQRENMKHAFIYENRRFELLLNTIDNAIASAIVEESERREALEKRIENIERKASEMGVEL